MTLHTTSYCSRATGTVPTVPNENISNLGDIPSVDSGGLSPLGPRHGTTSDAKGHIHP